MFMVYKLHIKILKITLLFLLIVIAPLISAQNWTEPLNISNMEGLDNVPDFTVDINGTFHCVWAHYIQENYWKIYYSKSTDEGNIWSTPEDISLNSEKWVFAPHIVCDSENNLHVSYEYDVGNYMQTMIYYQTFDGISWSEPINVSPNLPGSFKNKLTIDNTDKLYIFWYRGETCYYRYLDDGIWSEIMSPLAYDMVIEKAITDTSNNVHCIAGYNGGLYNKYVYFKYDNINNLWSDTIEVSRETALGADLDLDHNNYPHIAWYQVTPGITNENDSTLYRFLDGSGWSSPELVVEDPREQQIEIDENGKPNIFDTEKYEDGSMLVHHYYRDSIWEGYFIDESPWYSMFPVVENHNNKLLAVYVKPYMDIDGEIFFSKSDIITYADNNNQVARNLTMYPNPFDKDLHISYTTTIIGKVSIKVYNIQGKLINTLLKEGKISEDNQVIWNGKDQHGQAVSPGIYLIRFQAGRYIITRSVILVQ